MWKRLQKMVVYLGSLLKALRLEYWLLKWVNGNIIKLNTCEKTFSRGLGL